MAGWVKKLRAKGKSTLETEEEPPEKVILLLT
jgi:hypothetical protein